MWSELDWEDIVFVFIDSRAEVISSFVASRILAVGHYDASDPSIICCLQERLIQVNLEFVEVIAYWVDFFLSCHKGMLLEMQNCILSTLELLFIVDVGTYILKSSTSLGISFVVVMGLALHSLSYGSI